MFLFTSICGLSAKVTGAFLVRRTNTETHKKNFLVRKTTVSVTFLVRLKFQGSRCKSDNVNSQSHIFKIKMVQVYLDYFSGTKNHNSNKVNICKTGICFSAFTETLWIDSEATCFVTYFLQLAWEKFASLQIVTYFALKHFFL